MNKEEFIKECSNLGINITNEILIKLDSYNKLLTEWNKIMNLTNITEENEVYLKHFYDSLCLVKAVNLNKSLELCDVGTGAGFPGIVLKIVFPELKVTLMEPLGKRCRFLNEVIKSLNLKDIKVLNDRAEIYSKNNREIFDIVTCRAVANLSIISEISISMVKLGGYFIPMKGNVEKELINSKNILSELNSEIEDIIEYKLPIEDSIRTIIRIKKNNRTSLKFPRNYSIIKKETK